MRALITLIASCMTSFRAILTSPESGAIDEELCKEIMTQWLKVRLWVESVSLYFDSPLTHLNFLCRHEIEVAITQSINDLAIILIETEIEINEISRSLTYQDSEISLRRYSQELTFLHSNTRGPKYSLHNISQNVNKLKIVINDLEDISRKLNSSRSDSLSSPYPPSHSQDSTLIETTYSDDEDQVFHHHNEIDSIQLYGNVDPEIFKQYQAMKRFLEISLDSHKPDSNGRLKKAQIHFSFEKMRELRVDAYEEVIRRQQKPSISFSTSRTFWEMLSSKKHKKLSLLPSDQFENHVGDVISELDRVYPILQVRYQQDLERIWQNDSGVSTRSKASIFDEPLLLTMQDPNDRMFDPLRYPTSPITRRYGCILPLRTPLPDTEQSIRNHLKPDFPTHIVSKALPQNKAGLAQPKTSYGAVQTTPGISDRTEAKSEDSRYEFRVSQVSTTKPTRQNYKRLSVCSTDTTHLILKSTLKEHQTKAPNSIFELCIRMNTARAGCGEERRLGPCEYPLDIFQELERKGKNPVFVLRRSCN